jgi:hypothetical protein
MTSRPEFDAPRLKDRAGQSDREVRLTIIAAMEAKLRNSPDLVTELGALLVGVTWDDQAVICAVTTMATLFGELAQADIDRAQDVLYHGRRAAIEMPGR